MRNIVRTDERNGSQSIGMKVISTEIMEKYPVKTVVCLGYFDGVHIGHQALIRKAQQIARQEELEMALHTFDMSPFQFLHPEMKQLILTDFDEKKEILSQMGCELMFLSHFDEKMCKMPGKQFFEEVLLHKLNAAALVVGDDHRFGYKGDTDAAALSKLCTQYGIKLSVIEKVCLPDGRIVSSTAIRDAIKAGDSESVRTMLGMEPGSTMISRCLEAAGEVGNQP